MLILLSLTACGRQETGQWESRQTESQSESGGNHASDTGVRDSSGQTQGKQWEMTGGPLLCIQMKADRYTGQMGTRRKGSSGLWQKKYAISLRRMRKSPGRSLLKQRRDAAHPRPVL